MSWPGGKKTKTKQTKPEELLDFICVGQYY